MHDTLIIFHHFHLSIRNSALIEWGDEALVYLLETEVWHRLNHQVKQTVRVPSRQGKHCVCYACRGEDGVGVRVAHEGYGVRIRSVDVRSGGSMQNAEAWEASQRRGGHISCETCTACVQNVSQMRGIFKWRSPV